MQLDPNQKITFIGLIIAVIIGSGYYFYNHLLVPKETQAILDSPHEPHIEKPQPAEVVVYISGAVPNEGVYNVPSGSRVYQAIKLAGGSSHNADFSSVNLAETVKDGMRILIPRKEYPAYVKTSAGRQDIRDKSNKKININTASVEELDELPGVGTATAKKIVEARPFRNIEDLVKIPRFGKGKIDKIKHRITI